MRLGVRARIVAEVAAVMAACLAIDLILTRVLHWVAPVPTHRLIWTMLPAAIVVTIGSIARLGREHA